MKLFILGLSFSGAIAWAMPVKPGVSVSSLTSLLNEPIEQRVSAFRALGPPSYPFLSDTVANTHESLQTRWRAVTTMGRLDPVRFRKQIDAALTHPEWFIRNAALIALLNDDRTRTVAWSARLLRDPALVVRTQAVRNLIALNGREAEGNLWRELYDRHNYRGRQSLWIRAHVAEALAKFAGPGRAKAFERMLLDEDPRLYKWAVNGLEASTGVRLSDKSEDTELRRQKWLARLGVQAI